MVWAANRDRSAAAQRDLTADIASLRALRKDRAPHNVVNLGGIDAGAFNGSFEGKRAERCAGRGVEPTLVGAADWRACGRDDDCVA